MKATKVMDRINLCGSELDAMVTNDDLPMGLRCKAGRIHFDLIEEYNYLLNNSVPKGMLRDLMVEYETAVMDLYKKI